MAAVQTPIPSLVTPPHRGWRDYALLLALACCWSSTYPLTKIGLGSIPPITFISARSLIAAGFLLVILRARGIRIPADAKAWKLFAFQQTINSTIPFLMITWAQQYVTASITVVLASTTPIFAFVITWGITRHEPATLLKLAGAVLGLAGTAARAFGLMLFYMCLTRRGTLTTNAQGYLRIPIGVGLSVLLLGETVPSNLALGLLLVMAGVAAMTMPKDGLRRLISRNRTV